ncbi:hypothetical protein GGR51DRAFT_548228 [Nemania sp. FL0031]|nr:hypothetical protein GGR51DRAFT_548228 [Nemania sp. FL0031]
MSSLHPNRISGIYQNYSIVTGVLLLLSGACVTLRFIQRHQIRDFWWDDWTILIAMVLGLGVFIVTILISIPSIGAAGYHINTYSLQQLSTWAKYSLANEVFYNFSIACSKISIILFYRRIYSIDTGFLVFMRVMFSLIIGVTLSAVFGLIFSYNPVQAQWDFSLPHTTIAIKPFFIIAAVLNILLDVAILGFAQLKLWRVQVDSRRKLLLSGLFILGGLTIVSTLLRIVFMVTIDLSDPTYSLAIPGLLTNIDMYLSIICACLPVLYSLFRASSHGRSPGTRRLGESSTRKTSTLRDISSTSDGLNPTPYSDASAYQVLCECGIDGETHSMAPLDPVVVRTRYSVISHSNSN